MCDHIQNHILLVGANGCSPEGASLQLPRCKLQEEEPSVFSKANDKCHPLLKAIFFQPFMPSWRGSGQDLCPSRKMGQTIGTGQSLFSLTATSGFMFLSVQRFLERDAETSSDDAKGRVSITGYGVS